MPAVNAQAQAQTPAKVNKYLQPQTLTQSCSSQQLRCWHKDLRLFFDSGDICTRSSEIQQQYARKCMDECLSRMIQATVVPATPVF